MSKNAIFSPNWVLGPFLPLWPSAIFWLGQKTKSDFFHKIITSFLLSNPFWWPEKLVALINQIYFGKICYCVPRWSISKHGFFEPLGDSLWPCDSLLLWTGLFIQIHSETLCEVCLFEDNMSHASTGAQHPCCTATFSDFKKD